MKRAKVEDLTDDFAEELSEDVEEETISKKEPKKDWGQLGDRAHRQRSGIQMGPLPDWFATNPKRPVMMGVDEAGRGSVIGPMPYGACYWPIDCNEELSKKGFDDSKKLTEAQRDALLKKVHDTKEAGWILRVIHASEISESMLKRWLFAPFFQIVP